MIRRLQLRGWRSFEEQSLEVGPGVTFVLAENGVGKTSLIEAAAWGVYGDLSGVDAVAARRIGTDDTSVEVDVELPDRRVLTIRRAIGVGREPSVEVTLGGDAVDPQKVDAVLAEAFGASADFLARTTTVPSSAVTDERVGAFALHEHLCRVLGVDDLNRVADQLEQIHDENEAEAKGFRSASRRATADLAALTGQLAAAEEELAALEEQRAGLRSDLEHAEEHLRQARRHAETTQRVAAARAAFEVARAAAEAVVPASTLDDVHSIDELVRVLEDAERSALTATDELRQALAGIAGRIESITGAAAELDTAAGDCPVCRRPMSDEDVLHARRSHEADLAALQQDRATRQARLGQTSQQLDAVRAVLRQALAVPSPPAQLPSGGDLDVDTARAGVDEVRVRHDDLSEEVAAARAMRTTLAERIAAERAAAGEQQASLHVHRKAAVSRMGALIARETANRLLEERIDPLAAEVRSRWKRVFGDRGALQLGANGRLTLRRGVDDIPFEYLSSGEKVVALLAVRLLVLGSSTRASFLWLDEPLEHLDPRNRRLAASLMSAAGTQVRQVLVTTYEEDLARQLARRKQASILRVQSADETWLPSTFTAPAPDPERARWVRGRRVE
ncbi:MAG TPA: AAA family ATPase [Mycobacteriales bacterium]|nr:AAA family ATPase [Mycobacteriales bacterium]